MKAHALLVIGFVGVAAWGAYVLGRRPPRDAGSTLASDAPVHVTASASAAGARSPVADTPEGRLVLVQREGAEPIERASVRWARRTADGRELESGIANGGGGEWRLPRGRVLVTVRSAGFASEVELLDLGAEPVTLALERAAELRLEFVTEAAPAGLADIEVALFADALAAPVGWTGFAAVEAALVESVELENEVLARGAIDEGAELALELACVAGPQRVGAGGELVFGELRAPGPYRWAARPPPELFVVPEPAHEQRAVRPAEGGGFVVADEPPPFVSGAFELVAGVTTRFEVLVRATGSVRGRVALDPALAREPARVSVLDATRHEAPDGARLARRTSEAEASTDGAGVFEIRGLRDGEKLLRASWREGERALFARRPFLVVEGSRIELGDVHPLVGPGERVRVVLRDESGAELAAEDALEGAREPVPLSIAWTPEGGSPAEGVIARIEVPFHSTLELCGFGRPGILRVQVGDGPWAARGDAVLVRPSEPIEVVTPSATLGGATAIEVPFVVARSVPVRFRLPGLEARDTLTLRLWLRGVHTGRGVDLRIDAARGVSTTRVRMPPGEYEAFAREIGGGDGALCFDGPLLVGADGAAELALAPGASIEGVALDARGEPLRAPTFLFAPGWDGFSIEVRADADGRFRVDGLQPHREYRLASGASVTTGAPGSIVEARARPR